MMRTSCIGELDVTHAKTKTVHVVRKHVLDKDYNELRYEDYPQKFSTPEEALPLLEEKQEKYDDTLQSLLDDGSTMNDIPERRRYEIVPIEVPL